MMAAAGPRSATGMWASKASWGSGETPMIIAPRAFIWSAPDISATFSPELVDATIYVIDVAEGDKIPRKGGPGIMRSDLLVINKIDLAPYVGADLGVMERDARRMRGERPFVFTNLREGHGADDVVSWIRRDLLFVS